MVTLIVSALLSAASARAEVPENQYVYLQATGGVLAPMDSRQSATLGVGAAVGMRTSPFFTLGGYFYYATQKLAVVTNETSVDNYAFGPEFTYYPRDFAELDGFSISAMTGFTYRFFTSLSSSTGVLVREESGALNFVFGPKVTYEYTVDLGLAFGGQAFLLYDFADARTGPLGIQATVRVWF